MTLVTATQLQQFDLFGDVINEQASTSVRQKFVPAKVSVERSYHKAFQVRKDILAQQDNQSEMFEAIGEATMYLSGVSSLRDLQGCIQSNQNICINTIDIKSNATKQVIEYLNSPDSGYCFCDSGAYRVLDTSINKPIDFDEVFDYYFLLANNITEPSKLTVCAPDVIGEQALSLDLQICYQHKINQLIGLGVNVIFPLQKGMVALHDVYTKLIQCFGQEHVIAGLPAAAEALSRDDFKTFLGFKPQRVHILGANKNKKIVKESLVFSPTTVFSCDSNRILAYIGEARPLTQLHHDLTDTVVDFYDGVVNNIRHEVNIKPGEEWIPDKFDYCLDYTEFEAEYVIEDFNESEFSGLCKALAPYLPSYEMDLSQLKGMLRDKTLITLISEEYSDEFAYKIHDVVWDYYREVLEAKLTVERASPLARTQSIHVACTNHLFDVPVN